MRWIDSSGQASNTTRSKCQKDKYTEYFFAISQPEAITKVMGVLNAINVRWGMGTMRLASVPTDLDTGMRGEMMSQIFTTCVDQLWTVYCKYTREDFSRSPCFRG